jgi:hypothetical protein
MHDAGAHIMGGMTKDEARSHLKKIGWSEQRIKKHEMDGTDYKSKLEEEYEWKDDFADPKTHQVLSKKDGNPVRFVNKTQANAAAAKHGGEVKYHTMFGRTFYVKKKKEQLEEGALKNFGKRLKNAYDAYKDPTPLGKDHPHHKRTTDQLNKKIMFHIGKAARRPASGRHDQGVDDAVTAINFRKYGPKLAPNLEEGRLAMPLKGHEYHYKPDNQLHYIMKDAHEAAQNMKGHNPQAEGKYLDQVNDAATVLGYRKRGGKQLVKKEDLKEESWSKASTYTKHPSKHGFIGADGKFDFKGFAEYNKNRKPDKKKKKA